MLLINLNVCLWRRAILQFNDVKMVDGVSGTFEFERLHVKTNDLTL